MMEPRHAAIIYNVVALRAEPDGGSEQVSQAIMGDGVTVLEERGDYAYIGTQDAYEGWVLRQHLRWRGLGAPSTPAPGMLRVAQPILDALSRAQRAAPIQTKLVFGTRVLDLGRKETEQGAFRRILLPNDETRYVAITDETPLLPLHVPPRFDAKELCALSQRFIGTPYLWGGTTPFGFDCSGFVQRLYDWFGVTLPRDAYLQAQSPLGATVPEGKLIRAGDLVFFGSERDPRNRGVTHVGMVLDSKRFIHASGKLGVAITPFDDFYYRRYYRGAWRYTPPSA